MKKNSKIIILLVIILMVCLPGIVTAQPPIDEDNVLDNPVPFDDGVFILVALAIGYGFKKLSDNKKPRGYRQELHDDLLVK